MNILTNKKPASSVTVSVFEKHMAVIAKSSARADERLDEMRARSESVEKRLDEHRDLLQKMLAEIADLRSESREDRLLMGTLAYNDMQYKRNLDEFGARLDRLAPPAS